MKAFWEKHKKGVSGASWSCWLSGPSGTPGPWTFTA